MPNIHVFFWLLFIVLVATQYFKKRFNLDGWQVNVVAFLIALAVCFGYSAIVYIPWYKVILTAIGLFIAACGAFDLLKELMQWIGTGVHRRMRAVIRK